MKIRFLKDIRGAVHCISTGEEFTLPFEIFDKKTTHKMNIEYVVVENKDIFPDGFYVSFSSNSNRASDGYCGSCSPLRLGIDFEFIDETSEATSKSEKPIQQELI
jgi:hypothetical protein